MAKDYRETLNLPKTSFPMRANLPRREPEMLKFWKDKRVYYRMLEKRKDAPTFILHDGPPYSNGHIHLGTALNKILKDIFIKYKSIKGFKSPYVPGWDNHGMPIENEVVRTDPALADVRDDPNKLRKPEIKAIIRKKCREFAAKWVEIQKSEFIRLGVLGDWDNPYLTMSKDYEAGEIEIFADLVEKGYIYRGNLPIHWCPSCQTALAMLEVEYHDKESPSLWFRTEVVDGKGVLEKGTYIVVWTTTPWTLVANRAFAFHPDYDYALFEVNGTTYLMAELLLPVVADILGWENYTKVKRINGTNLEGVVFKHPLFSDRVSPGILADFVTLTEGTGIVHIAPGHGKEDFEIGQQYGIEPFSPVDETGRFTKDAGPEFEGLFVGTDGSQKAIEVLKRVGNFLHLETITHSYPHCWRCKNPAIFRATTQWFMSVDHADLRNRALEEISSVKWHPGESINRIYNSVKERPDWVLSRQRAWGVNLPIFFCKNCGEPLLEPEVMRFVAKIFREEGADAWLSKSESELIPGGTRCKKCGAQDFQKEMDILDVWFDSGATNLIVLSEKRGLNWPADMFLEGSDQHRGWFNASLMLAVAQRGRAPYKTVVTHGWTLDEQGRAMHKSLGNVISPDEITDKYGADVLRLWVASSDYTEDVRLGPEILQRLVDAYRKIRNTFRFMLANLYDFDPDTDSVPYDELLPVDKYMLHKYSQFLESIESFYESYETHRLFHKFYNFTGQNLSAFYLDVLKDRLYTWAKTSIGRRSAQTTIYTILKGLLTVFSPVLSFTCEEAWQNLPGDHEESVFLSDWPLPDPKWNNPELAEEFDTLMRVRDLALVAIEVARKDEGLIQDRLEVDLHIHADDSVLKTLEKYYKHLPELFIVSSVNLHNTPIIDSRTHEDDGIVVLVKRVEGKKCARCWMWSKEVGTHSEYPDLCPKCVSAIGGD